MNRKKILIIDDEENFAVMVKLNLESTGYYEVKIVTDPCDALQQARQYKPDLVLLDVIMAKKEGPDVAMDFKRDPDLHATPVIFLTATITQKEADEGGGAIGGHPFVAKPSALDVLIDAIDKNMVAA